MASKKSPADCTCWEDKSKKLAELHGFRISKECELFTMEGLNLGHTYCLPLQRCDGQKLKRADPKSITISHCPFCGVKYPSSTK